MATLGKLIKNKQLLTLGISESVSSTGSWITMMAVFAMLVFHSQGGVAASSGVYLAGLLPTLLFSPVAGWLCDRFDRRRLMIASELISGAVTSGLFFAREPAWIYTLLAIQAVSVSIMTPARQAVVPLVVPQSELTRANAFLGQLAGIIKIAAPSLAGLVLVFLNPHQAILLDVLSYILSALILSRLPALPPRPEKPGAAAGAPGGEIWPALRVAGGLRTLFAGSFLAIAVVVGFDIVAPVYTRDVLRGGESLFGLMVSLVGFGTLGATLILLLRKGQANPWRDMAAGLFLLGMIPGLLALAVALDDPSQARVLTLAGALVGGVGNGLLQVQAGTLLQLLSPARLLGRMSGIFQMTAVSGQLVGILITPLLVPGVLPMGLYFGLMAVALGGVALFVALASAHPWAAEADSADRA